MKKMIHRIVVVAGIAMLFAASVAHAEVTAASDKVVTPSTTTAVDKGDQEKKSDTETKDKGWRKNHDEGSGFKTATVNSLSHGLDNVNAKSFAREMSLVPILVKPYLVDFPWLKMISLDDVLIESTDNGQEITYVENLSAFARANADTDRFLNRPVITGIMNTLQAIGNTISKSTTPPPKDYVFGTEDWAEIAKVNHDHFPLVKPRYDVSGRCRFVGDIQTIACGECTLSLSQKQGLPELYCSGLPVFTTQYAGGVSLKASVNDTYSIRDAESQSQNDENFRQVSDLFSRYVSESAAKGHAVEATFAKKVVYQNVVSKSKRVNAAIKAVQAKEEPSSIVGMMIR